MIIAPYTFQGRNVNVFGNDWEVPDPERDHPFKDKCKVPEDEDPTKACDPPGFADLADKKCHIFKETKGKFIYTLLL